MQNQELISYEALSDQLYKRDRRINCFGLSGSEKAYLISKIFLQHRLPCLVIVSSTREAESLMDDLRFFANDTELPLLFFPPYNILPFKNLAYHNETAGYRIRVLYQLLNSEKPSILVTTVDALLQKIIPKSEISRYPELIIEGEEIDRDYLITKLISGGYSKTAIVEEYGDFSVRGGIIDIFSPLYPHPLRIEFYGDLVESLRFFSASSQRKLKSINEAVILPAKEVILSKKLLPLIISRIRSLASELEVPVSHARKIIDSLRNDADLPGLESLIPLIYPQLDTLFDYIAENAMVITINPDHLEKVARETEERVIRNFNSSCEQKKLCVEPQQLYLNWTQAAAFISEKKPLAFKLFDVLKPGDQTLELPSQFTAKIENNSDLSMELKNLQGKEQLFKPLVEWLMDKKNSGLLTLVACRSKPQAERLNSLLAPYGLQLTFANSLSELQHNRGRLFICIGQLSSGFVWPQEFLAVVTDDEIFGVQQRRRKPSGTGPRTQFLDMQELKKDDLIVHNEHGIGQYGGLTKLKIDGLNNDFLVVTYKGGDKLYLPVDRMNMVQKYMGVDSLTPVLDVLGGKSWERVKSRVKKSAERIAGELLKLYAQRRVEQGYSFAPLDSYV
ncbi:MAG: transcription-repair coupling factor, partial [Deltaproteobacteria bacterium]|nr:transcription-repair coupling factor [Deltaproteobacteria bacterium]